MSSFSTPRAVAIGPAGASGVSKWAPDELPAGFPEAALSALERLTTPPGVPAAEERLARASEDGYSRGYEQGFRAGEFAEAARLRSAVAALEEALVSVEREAARWVGNAEENVCALAVTVARHLVAREIATDPAIVADAVRLALAEFPVEETVRVRMNPQDLQAVTTLMAADANRAVTRASIRWTGDARMAPGGCLIEGHERIIDGRVDVALERMYRRLSNAGS